MGPPASGLAAERRRSDHEYYAGFGGPTNNGTGAGSVAPIMGVSYNSERGLWWSGTQTGYSGLKTPEP